MWPSGQPCAVERDALSGRGSRLSPGASAYQRIISNNFYADDEQGVNPGQVRGFDGVLYISWVELSWVRSGALNPALMAWTGLTTGQLISDKRLPWRATVLHSAVDFPIQDGWIQVKSIWRVSSIYAHILYFIRKSLAGSFFRRESSQEER